MQSHLVMTMCKASSQPERWQVGQNTFGNNLICSLVLSQEAISIFKFELRYREEYKYISISITQNK